MLSLNERRIAMKMVFSDLPENADDAPSANNSEVLSIGVDELIKDIKEMIEDDANHKERLSSYLTSIEKQIESQNKLDLKNVDREAIKKLIGKHPYFKNPNSYHIRMITIMKYLKKKQVDVSIPDFDLLIDEIIQTMDGVTKVADGKYKKKSK